MVYFFEHAVENFCYYLYNVLCFVTQVYPKDLASGDGNESGILHYTPQSGAHFPTWMWISVLILGFIYHFIKTIVASDEWKNA